MEPDSSVGSVVHLLHKAAQAADGAFIRAVRGLTPRQFEILKAVAASEGLSQTGLVLATGIDRSTVSSITRHLVTSGYLARRRIKTDTRTFSVRLTEKGRRELERAEPMADKINGALLKRLPIRDRARFLKFLATFAKEDA